MFLSKVVRGTNLRGDAMGTYHELGNWGAFGDPLFYECVGENYFCEFDSDVVLVRCPILGHRRTNADGRNGYVLPDILFRSAKF